MSTGAQQTADDTLYELLPAVYRMRDAAQPGSPLRSLLRAIANQADGFATDIGQLYDNWFIETCDDDLVPYFAELVGLTLGPFLPTSGDSPSAGGDAIWRRSQVANAIADRRRKGSFSVLQQLAAQATGWPARAVELRAAALATQSVRMTDIGRRRLPAVSDMDALDLLATPLSQASPLTDVRRLSSHRTPGTVDPNGVAVWLWRLTTDAVTRAPAAFAGEEGRYTFDQLGRDASLAVIPAGSGSSAPTTDLDVAIPITRTALELRLEDYYGPGRSICVYRGGKPIPRSEIIVTNLQHWRTWTPVGRVSIDPVLGRIAFPARHAPEEPISVSCARLAIGAIGGGSYPRPIPSIDGPVYRVGARVVGLHRTIGGALRAWREANRNGKVPCAVVEIADDDVYSEHLDVRLAAGEQLTIRAAQGCRPIVIPIESGGGRPAQLRVRGAEDGVADQLPTFTLDGVWIARHSLDLHDRLGGVYLRHCTLVPAGGLAGAEAREGHHAPSIVVHGNYCPISIASSVLGRIRIESPETGIDPLPLCVADSVLDASDVSGLAVLGADQQSAWVRLSLSRVTVLGGADVHSIGLAEDSILTGPLDCERRQTGHVRFSYIPPGSRTPKRTSCLPDGSVDRARLVPRFDSVEFGRPAYARLASDVAVELTRGAHDEGELGAYHDLWQSLRIAELRSQLRSFAPVGTDIDVRLAT